MMAYLEFDKQITAYNDCFSASLTKTVINLIESTGKDVKSLMEKLSKQSKLTFVPYYSNDKESGNKFKLFTQYGTFMCIAKEDGQILLISFYPPRLLNQNEALKFGSIYSFEEGIAFTFNDVDRHYFFQIWNGNVIQNKEQYKKMSSSTIQSILNEMNSLRALRGLEIEQEDEPDDYYQGTTLGKYLDLAEGYTNIEDDIEKQKVIEFGTIYYSKVEASDYNRIDRSAFKFTFEHEDPDDLLSSGTSLDIEDKRKEKHPAEIIEAKKRNNRIEALVLFRNQINISDFGKSGTAELSYSTVVMDVQKEAIDKIRRKKSVAKYFEDVLGNYCPKGFNQNDFRELDAQLKKKKYPPNPSQTHAIKEGINSKDVYLVMGPPGTGKTTVILEWVKYFVQEKKMRVLVSSQNNKAVDNVLARIGDEKDIDVLRIGSESKIQSDVQPFMFENKLRTTRNQITKTSAENVRKMQQGIKDWNQFSRYLDIYQKDIHVVLEARNDLNAKIHLDLLPDYETLMHLKGRNTELKEELNQVLFEANELKNKLEKYKKEGSILAFFHQWSRKKSEDRFVECRRRFDEIQKELKEGANTYRSIYESHFYHAYIQCFKEFLHFQDEFNKPLYIKWKKLLEQFRINNYKARLKEVYDLSQYSLLDQENIQTLKQLILKTEEFYNKISSIVSEWNVKVSDAQNYALEEIVLSSVDLVGATCIGINSQRRFADLDFDVTIIDEAGQIQIHNALVPMSVSNKLIMLGDHKQIPPTADQELVEQCERNNIDSDLLSKSLFEEMYDHLPAENKTMLDTQFRMPAEIADILSVNFYQGKYKSFKGKRNLSSILPTISKRPFVLIDTSKEKNRYEQREDKGRFNACEVHVVEDLIAEIKRYYRKTEPNTEINQFYHEIGIISAYKSQVKHMQKALKGMVPNEIVNEMVASLDSFQGQERDIIIYSFTTSSNIPADKKRIGFLKELRRLNVAMSRCKKMLILIGDFDFLSSCKNDADDSYVDGDGRKYSEKEFSIFIQNMLKSVKNQNQGEFISYSDFRKRLEGGRIDV